MHWDLNCMQNHSKVNKIFLFCFSQFCHYSNKNSCDEWLQECKSNIVGTENGGRRIIIKLINIGTKILNNLL